MKPVVGFALVTHKDPEQILFLCHRLTAMFPDAPIAIHHDVFQSVLNKDAFPSNVRFVPAPVPTGWGTMGVVDALLASLRLLYRSHDGWGDPDWFVSLSSADYPIQSAQTILHDLQTTPHDGFLDSREIHRYPGRFRDQALGEFPFQQPRYHQFAFNRYVAVPLLSLSTARRLRIPVERYCLTPRWVTRRFAPFSEQFRCYAGDAWMTMRRRVADLFLEETRVWRTLYRHYYPRASPEESFYHTLLGNTPGFQISPDNLRYTDWKGCYAHPRTLGRSDFPRLLAVKHHFARKFAFDPQLLGELDDAVMGKETTRT